MATSRTWRKVRSDLRANGKLDDERIKEITDRLRGEVRMHRLAEIRDAIGLSQQALAELMGVSQSRVSQIERGELEHTEVATLRKYLEVLGGVIEICVRVGDDRLQIA
jgi:predicted XRE-type DNA-binding protein